jgi:hypothetical protein
MNTAQLVDGSLATGDEEARAAADIELSAVAGLERPPPVEHSVSIETAVPIASSPESKTTEPSEKSGKKSSSVASEAQKAEEKKQNNANFLKSVVDTLMQRLEAKLKDDAAVDAQNPAGLHSELIAKLNTLDKAEDILDMDFNCYNYCAPLLNEGKIWEPNRSREWSVRFTHPNFDSPITMSAKKGIYFGESKTVAEDGKKVPSGFGIWVSVEHHSETAAYGKPLCVFIMGGCWSLDGNNLSSLDGSMLHFFANDNGSSNFQRCVGFSYKGSFAINLADKPVTKTGAAAAATPPVPPTAIFDCQDKDAVFREFETAFKPKSAGGKMQVWLDMFIDSLSDDGLERQKCRDFRQHMIATGFAAQGKDDKNGYMQHILENYLGGGMQYFVPAIVHGT